MSAPQAAGLGNAKASETESGLGRSGAIPRAVDAQEAPYPNVLDAAHELLSALERLDRNFDLLLAGKPVRDVAETKAETRAALRKARGEQQ